MPEPLRGVRLRLRIPAMNSHLKELSGLPLSEKVQLVEDLWDNIAAELESMPLSEELKAEMDRRLQEYLKDPSTALSLEEVQARMRRRK